MDILLEIEERAKKITEQTKKILEENFPLDSREFLPREIRLFIQQNDDEIIRLDRQYLNEYKKLPPKEQITYKYKNIRGDYYLDTHMSKGLIFAYPRMDEYELHEAFQRATKFGMQAIDSIHLASKTNDEQLLRKSQLVLKNCEEILSIHYWGEERLKYLSRYIDRLKKGRTIEEDIEDYKLLIQETKMLAIEYARAILNGISEEEIRNFKYRFEEIFKREISLTEFVPKEILSEVKVNLHWIKVDVERDPKKMIVELEQEDVQRKK